ncbi:MAG TPA: hypothetical protein VHI14_06920 [Jatrophihabitantaceae bacterium]|nr:hypothetical protein [Jatrophihabitantaceae bacterium]
MFVRHALPGERVRALVTDVGGGAFCREAGWRLADLRAVDGFPMTQHVECVAWLLPVGTAD